MGVSRPHDAARLIKSTTAHASGFLWFLHAVELVDWGEAGKSRDQHFRPPAYSLLSSDRSASASCRMFRANTSLDK